MPLPNALKLLDLILAWPRRRVVSAGLAMVSAIALMDWYVGYGVTLGALYIVPMVLLSLQLSRAQIVALGATCTTLRLTLNPPPTAAEAVTHAAFAVFSYTLLGLLVSEVVRHRQKILLQLDEIQQEQRHRQFAEQQFRILAESSPAAFVTLDDEGKVMVANLSAAHLLGFRSQEELLGRTMDDLLPALAAARKLDKRGVNFRTVTQVQGRRIDGTPFLAQASLSSFVAPDGKARLAAIIVDSTDEVREREVQSQQQMWNSNRIVAGAVAHEVRNVCGAMSVYYANLLQLDAMADNRDLESLGKLISGLQRMAKLELHGRAEAPSSNSDLRDVINQLRILLAPSLEEADAVARWPRITEPVMAAADSVILLQAALNLSQNSLSALAQSSEKVLQVSLYKKDGKAYVTFEDSGCGVANPAELFQPFRSGSGHVGLGLYVSRALLRRYGGDIRYEPVPAGARFLIEVPLSGVDSDVRVGEKRYQNTAGG